MSASDKKKLRKEYEAEVLTARQLQEKKDAKKLKIATIALVAAMAVVVCIALGSLAFTAFQRSGYIEKHTIAATIGDEQINSVVLSYYYNDAINEMYSKAYEQYTSYFQLYFDSMGLDLSKPLDEQTNPDTGDTWAQFFIDSALESAKSDYTIAKLAKEAGFTLPEDEQANISTMATINYGSSGDAYLAMIYGNGAEEESYREYLERTALADAYYAHYYEEALPTDEEIRDYDKEHAKDFNSYSYSYSYLSYTEFLEGGTENEDGEKVYSDEEKAAAREALKKAAEEMATAKSLEELEEKAEKVEVNETSQVAVNAETNMLYTSINGALADWLADSSRKEGDIGAIPNISGEGDEAVTNGYYVAYFDSKTDNATAMGNVRHLLIKYEGGEEDEETGETVYSDEEKAVAREEAEKLLKEWKDGEATEESFIQLVKDHSQDGNAAEGGLYEDINPATEFVSEFLDWCIDPDRKKGDVEIVETMYGAHIMYYVEASELNYRDHMIADQMKTAKRDAWYEEALAAVTATALDTSKIKTDLVIGG